MPSTAMMVVIDAVTVVITGAEVVVTISLRLRAAIITRRSMVYCKVCTVSTNVSVAWCWLPCGTGLGKKLKRCNC